MHTVLFNMLMWSSLRLTPTRNTALETQVGLLRHHQKWYLIRYLMVKVASFPGLPRFYCPFRFTIIHAGRRPAKNGEGLGAFIT